MRFLEKSKGSNDQDVYSFKVGKTELLILRDVFNYLHRIVPRSLFTQPFTSRMDNMRKEINNLVLSEQIGKDWKRPKKWMPEDPMETF